ncbi:MAG: monofunctional biosynthetic peptidoglycan transglycosylase [Acidobacteriota bacterium]|nr:monofunctional biosynthetic peptidoglycan transglycosylase [Acidobacteriota bacterium]
MSTGRGRWRVRRRRPFRLIIRLALAFSLASAAFVGYQWVTWPQVSKLATENPQTTAFIERYRDAAVGRETQPVRWTWVRYEAISPHLKHAVVVSEDIEFFAHQGFSVHELKTAVADALKRRKALRGASTISQQLAKNLWLAPSRNPWRKVKEALLTRQLERELGKQRILEIYLNVVEFGPGLYGAEAAARHYFGRAAAELNPEQAAALAAGMPKPSRWHPGSGESEYLQRVRRIGERMRRTDWLRRLI